MNNLNQIVTLQQDRRGVYVVPKPTLEPSTALSADTKAGLAKAGLALAAFAIAPHVCLVALGLYGAAQIEARRNQYKPKVKSEAEHKMPPNIRVGYARRKTTEVTKFTHIKTVEEHEFF